MTTQTKTELTESQKIISDVLRKLTEALGDAVIYKLITIETLETTFSEAGEAAFHEMRKAEVQ